MQQKMYTSMAIQNSVYFQNIVITNTKCC